MLYTLGGLPRSGSTLLSALLRQNPDIEVTPTGFLINLVMGCLNQWTHSATRQAWLDQDEAKQRLHNALRGACEGYLESGKMVTIEKTRGMFQYLELLQEVFGNDFRIIACVRDLRGILASMEKLYRSHPEYFGFGAGTSVGERVEKWLSPDQAPLGDQASLLRDAFQRGVVDPRVVPVRFEDLVTDPEQELRRIYKEALGQDYPQDIHRFDHVQDENREHDAVHGLFGDHEIQDGPVSYPRDDWEEVLGKTISDLVVQNNQWFYQTFYPEKQT